MKTNQPKRDHTNHARAGQSAAWQTPLGVTKANWEYSQANHISEGYDEFLEDDPLTHVDRQIIDRYFPSLAQDVSESAPIVADFGCGNGRTLIPLLHQGYRGLGIDLSFPMLQGFSKKTLDPSPNFEIAMLSQANLVELDAFRDNCVDHAISMFSTLGMIQGAKNRSRFLNHARRMIKPNGLLLLHAHNVWYQLRHYGGISWAISNAISALRNKSEFGDRTSNYRNIKNMYIHSFRKNELRQAIKTAGFDKLSWYGIRPQANSATEGLGFASALRNVGWIVACQ